MGSNLVGNEIGILLFLV